MKEFVEKLISRLEDLALIESEKCNRFAGEGNEDMVIKYNHGQYCYTNVKHIINQLAEEYNNCSIDTSTDCSTNNGWIPVDMEVPPNDNYVMVSFDNYSLPDIARYEEDSEGGAFYPGDEEKSYASFGLFVNAWRPLPEPYRPTSNSEIPNSWQQQTMSRFERVD